MKLIDLIFRMNYTLLQGSLEQDITEVIYDSRKAVPGCIFLCLPGAVTDGHKYIPDVLEKGAVALVVEQDVKVPEHITVLKVDNSRVALAELAAAWYGHPAEKLILTFSSFSNAILASIRPSRSTICEPSFI